MDRLEAMMHAQGKFQESLDYDFEEMSDKGRIEFIKDMVLALTDELHEALGEVGWKPWATSKHINRDAYVGELVDAWHFFMNLLLVVGVSPDEFSVKYHAKLQKNYDRQQEGYDGIVGKCPGCKRAYDDEAVNCYPPGREYIVTKEGTRTPTNGFCFQDGVVIHP